MPYYDVTFTAKALWDDSSRQTDYELGNEGMEHARRAFADLDFGNGNAALSRVWATLDTNSGDRGTDIDGCRIFFVNVVVRLDADAEVAATQSVSLANAEAFERFVEIMLDEDCVIETSWRNLAFAEALDRGPTPTARMPGF